MYCVYCGVKLADSEEFCPLCGTKALRPEGQENNVQRLYPQKDHRPIVTSYGLYGILTALFLLAMAIPFQCDLLINGRVTWSGFVIGGVAVAYVAMVLPGWFQKPNPVIFTPCTFAAVGLYLLYIDLATGGSWFLSFGLPVTGFMGLLVTAMVTLLRYVPRGILYILGGAALTLGLFMPVMELLLALTFPAIAFAGWSWIPLTGLALLGGTLIFLAICRPARETAKRKLFI